MDAIVNKTAVSYKANRMIGGSAPSKYLARLQVHVQVKRDDAAMDAILKSRVNDPVLLRADSFQAFYAARKAALMVLVEHAMGKASADESAIVADDEADAQEDDAA